MAWMAWMAWNLAGGNALGRDIDLDSRYTPQSQYWSIVAVIVAYLVDSMDTSKYGAVGVFLIVGKPRRNWPPLDLSPLRG